jgi:CDP-paratose 2-epimerase
MLEAIALCEEIVGKKLKTTYLEANRSGDHIWYVSDVRKFESDYPGWKFTRDVKGILGEMYTENRTRWSDGA